MPPSCPSRASVARSPGVRVWPRKGALRSGARRTGRTRGTVSPPGPRWRITLAWISMVWPCPVGMRRAMGSVCPAAASRASCPASCRPSSVMPRGASAAQTAGVGDAGGSPPSARVLPRSSSGASGRGPSDRASRTSMKARENLARKLSSAVFRLSKSSARRPRRGCARSSWAFRTVGVPSSSMAVTMPGAAAGSSGSRITITPSSASRSSRRSCSRRSSTPGVTGGFSCLSMLLRCYWVHCGPPPCAPSTSRRWASAGSARMRSTSRATRSLMSRLIWR